MTEAHETTTMTFSYPAPHGTCFAPDAFTDAIGNEIHIQTPTGPTTGILEAVKVHDCETVELTLKVNTDLFHRDDLEHLSIDL